jgi:hypothetical protein
VFASDTSAPFSVSLDTTTLTNAAHTLQVKAYDPSGNMGSSSSVSVNVSNSTSANKSHLSLSPSSMSFSGVSGDAAPAVQNVVLSNAGSASSSWAAVFDQPWCHMTPASGTLAVGSSVTLPVSMDDPSNVGTFTCNISIIDANADNSPQTLSITYTVIAPPTPAATPSITSFSVTAKSANSATIAWTTSSPTTGVLKYGLNKTSLSSQSSDTNLSTTHTITLTGLASKTAYYYQIQASNQAGSATSIISNFRTKPR